MSRRRRKAQVLLLAMPWARLEHPSIQLGLLKAILDARGIASKPMHLYVDFVDHMANVDPTLGIADYDDVASRHFGGDWIFSVPPFRELLASDEDYPRFLRGTGESDAFIGKMSAIRSTVPAFLDAAAADVLSQDPKVVGFTTTFGQTVASLVMAKVLKQRAPHLQIVFGGAGCDGDMGEALCRHFSWVDVVVRGEAEPVFADLIGALVHGREPDPAPGLCYRSKDKLLVVPIAQTAASIAGTRSRIDYDDYFSRLQASRFAPEISPQVSLPFESSRGCWWGEKHHCTFCGLNGSAMRFRSMEPNAVLDELLYLAERYQRLRFNAADNIIDRKLFRTLLPALAGLHYDFHIFYEVKANMRKAEVASLSAAGVTEIQPGIESLNSTILERMRKGTTALQNVRLLKWCAAHGIKVHWNIIYGTPGDTSDEYQDMARIARDCYHLDAPNLIPLSVERFSPYHDDPASYGIEILGANGHYRYAYPVKPEALLDMAYVFEHRVVGRGDLEPGLCALRAAVDEWQAAQQDAQLGTLKLYRGPGFAVIEDRRRGRTPSDYRLGTVEARIYEACDAGSGLAALRSSLAKRGAAVPEETTIEEFLDKLVDAGLVFREGTRYLSLAIEANPRDTQAVASDDTSVHRAVTLGEIGVALRAE